METGGSVPACPEVTGEAAAAGASFRTSETPDQGGRYAVLRKLVFDQRPSCGSGEFVAIPPAAAHHRDVQAGPAEGDQALVAGFSHGKTIRSSPGSLPAA